MTQLFASNLDSISELVQVKSGKIEAALSALCLAFIPICRPDERRDECI